MIAKKILQVQTRGVYAPERTYSPFILSATAAAMSLEAYIYFAIKGVSVVKKGEAEKVKLSQFPTLRQVMEQAIQTRVKFVVYKQSCMLLDRARGDLIPKANSRSGNHERYGFGR